jgi:dTDP-4-amino-4,6-dideoxygalactose transaminase
MPGALAMLALHQFKKLDRFNNHRIELAKFYSANLSGPVSSKDEKNIFLRYTVMVESPKKVANALKTKGILVGDWYTESIAPAGVQYGKIGYEPSTCPNAERLAQHSLNLPTAIGTSLKEAQYVVEKLKNI